MGQNDAASYLTEANTITVDNDGLGDRVVGASDGAILAMPSQQMFTLMQRIQRHNYSQQRCQHMGANSATDLDEALSVVVESGAAVERC